MSKKLVVQKDDCKILIEEYNNGHLQMSEEISTNAMLYLKKVYGKFGLEIREVDRFKNIHVRNDYNFDEVELNGQTFASSDELFCYFSANMANDSNSDKLDEIKETIIDEGGQTQEILQQIKDETNTQFEEGVKYCKDGSPTLQEYFERDAENPTALPIRKFLDLDTGLEVINPDLTGYKDCAESGEKAITYPIGQFTEVNTGMGYEYTMPLSNIPIGVINSVWVGTASMAQESQLNYTDDGTNLIISTNTQIESGKLIRISGE